MDREGMITLARKAAMGFVEGEKEFIGAYLTGSVAVGKYLSRPDLDIMVVWDRPTVLPGPQQHVVAEGIALELAYRAKPTLEDISTLLEDPILAAEMATAVPLWDPARFLEERQQAVRAKWRDPYWRRIRAVVQWKIARELLDIVRDERISEEMEQEAVLDFIRFVVEAGAVLPVFCCEMPTYRRHLLLHREACRNLDRLHLHRALLETLGAWRIELSLIREWMAVVHEMGDHACAVSMRDPREKVVYESKKFYYDAGITDLLEQGNVSEAVLPLLMMAGLYWGLIALHDPPGEAAIMEARWQDILHSLGLQPPEDLAERIKQGERYLEGVRDVIGGYHA